MIPQSISSWICLSLGSASQIERSGQIPAFGGGVSQRADWPALRGCLCRAKFEAWHARLSRLGHSDLRAPVPLLPLSLDAGMPTLLAQ